jgi:branched-chain amino acid aminotransferase
MPHRASSLRCGMAALPGGAKLRHSKVEESTMAVVEQLRDVRPASGQWPQGAAWVDGRFVPIEQAGIPITDWGFVRSDVTYDVAHVWQGNFFRLENHLDRFTASMKGLRMSLPFGREGIAQILHDCVRATGQRDAYAAMICTRGTPTPGKPRHPAYCVNRFFAFVIPWVWVMPPEMQERGANLIIAKTPRIPAASVDPTIKNYHWGDMTRGLFEAQDAGADNAVLLDPDGYVTEGPGFNVFAVIGGTVVSPDRGALEGITRMSVLELCEELGIPARLGRITADDLRGADEVFCATTAGGVMPVSQVDGKPVSGGKPGPVSLRLRKRYWEKHTEGWHATPVDYD